MSLKPMLYKILAAFLVVTILSSCNLKYALSAPTATRTKAPTVAEPTKTIAPSIDQNLIRTQAAQTVIANMTMNAPTTTPVTLKRTSTATPTMSVTFTSLPPTANPTKTVTFTPRPPTTTSTATWIPWTLTPRFTPSGYSCAVTSTSPKPTDKIKVSTDFNWNWVIMNTGNWAWGQNQADLRYVNGTKMQTGGDIYDMPADVAPGDSVTATIAMKTPATAGTYTATWEIMQEGVLVCMLPLSVNVTN